MKNIDINQEFDFEKILEEQELPISINKEIVILDFNTYIQTLEKFDKEKAEKIIFDIKSIKFSGLFNDEDIKHLRTNLLETFNVNDELYYEDFKNKEILYSILGTGRFKKAIIKSCTDMKFDEFNKWYENLSTAQQYEFDCKIGELLYIQ